jgi:hypothetical protein
MGGLDAIEMRELVPSTTEHSLTYSASHFILDRIPARGITKAEHDAWVSSSGRAYTDRFVSAHQGDFALASGDGTTKQTKPDA